MDYFQSHSTNELSSYIEVICKEYIFISSLNNTCLLPPVLKFNSQGVME